MRCRPRSGATVPSAGSSKRDEDFPLRPLYAGLAVWVCIAVLLVAVRGVQWDESYEEGLVVTGRLAYPEGHPFPLWLGKQFTIQHYVSALLLRAGGGEALVNGIRNVLFILATVAPVYLFAGFVGRDPRWGHAAALLALRGVYREFDSLYALEFWPPIGTYGHIGMGWTLVSLYCLAAGHVRSAALLAGLLPLIHIGQFPALGLCGVVYIFWHLLRGDRATVLRAAIWAGAGAACCVVFAVISSAFLQKPMPAGGPYFSGADPAPIWQYYTSVLDFHRRLPPLTNSNIIVIMAILLACVAARVSSSRRDRHFLVVAALYCVIVGGLVWGTAVLDYALGPSLPKVFIMWMPYRLTNHAAPLALALVVGLLALDDKRFGILVLVGAVLWETIKLPLSFLGGAAWYDRYLGRGDFVLFGLYGAVFVALVLKSGEQSPRGPFRALAATAALALPLALFHQFGAFCVVSGGAIMAFCQRLSGQAPPRFRGHLHALSGVLIVGGLVLAVEQWGNRAHLPRTDFELAASAYLAMAGDESAPLLTDPGSFFLQARMGHPILAQETTPSYIGYAPELGPSIAKMYGELYGIRFRAPTSGLSSRDWKEVWAARTTEEWGLLSAKYGFEYVIANQSLDLRLPKVVEEAEMTLYLARSG